MPNTLAIIKRQNNIIIIISSICQKFLTSSMEL